MLGESPIKPLHSQLLEVALPALIWFSIGFFYVEGFLSQANPLERVLFCCLGGAVLVYLFEATPARLPLQIPCLKNATVAAVSALLVFVGVHSLAMTSVLASASVGIAAAVLPRWTNKSWEAFVPAAYCGSFVGMTSSLILVNPLWIGLAGFLSGCLCSISGKALEGVGGKLGFLAFTSVLLTASLVRYWGGIGPGATLIPPDSTTRIAILLAALCSAPITYWLSHYRGCGAVLGSALPSAVVALAMPFLGPWCHFAATPVAAAWFGASFAGMTSPHRIEMRHWLLPVKGLLFGILWIGFEQPLAGMGGILGATALVAVHVAQGSTRIPGLARMSLGLLRVGT